MIWKAKRSKCWFKKLPTSFDICIFTSVFILKPFCILLHSSWFFSCYFNSIYVNMCGIINSTIDCFSLFSSKFSFYFRLQTIFNTIYWQVYADSHTLFENMQLVEKKNVCIKPYIESQSSVIKFIYKIEKNISDYFISAHIVVYKYIEKVNARNNLYINI